MKRFVCGVTIYRPKHDVVERIRDYSNSFELVYVFDNTEEAVISHEICDEIKAMEKVVYLGCGENKGLPYAFNRILEKISDETDYLCTLDQDSTFSAEDVASMQKKLSSLPDDLTYGIVAPRVIYGTENAVRQDEINSVRYVITSGSFLSLAALRKNNVRYDEAYFIDKFEIDLCEQLKKLGFRIGQYQGAILHQQLGELDHKGRRNHSALRHYYLFRNRFYFNRKFYAWPKRYLLNVLQVMRHVSIILFREEKKKDKLGAFPSACHDYVKKNFGKRES